MNVSFEDPQHQHFKTDHLLPDLKRRTVKSGAVTLSSQGAKFGLHMVSTVVLARLLSPSDFGLVAMVASITGFLRVFKEAGLSIATVQRDQITHAQVSNLFWINISVSVISSALVASAAPLLVWFYGDSRLFGVTLALSLTFLLTGSAVQHQALLRRQMRFKSLALIEISAITLGAGIAITMARLGFGYWSLVGLNLSMEATSLIMTWSISRWRPQLPARNSGTRPLLRFGAARTLGDFFLAVSRGSDNLLIGRVYGAEAVGLYSRASALLLMPLRQMLSPINTVFIPALSRLQAQPERYRSTFLRLYSAIAITSFFFTGLLLALARPVTLVLLGPKWEEAAVIFGGFTFAALCIPLSNAAAWLFTSQGRGRDMLIAQSIFATATICSFVVGLPFGPVGVAIAFSASNLLIRMPVYYYRAGRSGPVTTGDLWRVFLHHLPIWFIVLISAEIARRLTGSYSPAVQLLFCVPIGCMAGAAYIGCVPSQRDIVSHAIRTIRDLKKRRRPTDTDHVK